MDIEEAHEVDDILLDCIDALRSLAVDHDLQYTYFAQNTFGPALADFLADPPAPPAEPPAPPEAHRAFLDACFATVSPIVADDATDADDLRAAFFSFAQKFCRPSW